jgi:hypothetical protein
MLVMNIDGTIEQDNGKIHKQTREALDFALQKGIYITLATSRHFPAAKRAAKMLKLDSYLVTHQGGFIAKHINKPIYVNRNNEQTTGELVTLLESFSCQIRIVHEKFLLANKVKIPNNMLSKVVFQSASRFIYQERYVDSLSERLLDEPASPPKIEVIFFSEKDLEDAKKAIGDMYHDEIQCIEPEPLKMEITGAGASKLNGVRYICDHFGIKQQEVVAIGSGSDDIPLVRWAGLGVAMGNAPIGLQDAADWITRTNNENGLSYVVKEHFRKQYRIEFLRKNNMLK